VAATFFQVRFGLSPLRAIRERLAAIRSGEAEKLEGELPLEIKPLQQELNALIQSNREIVERARTHVGNLAHALKTPLSVISNEARTQSDALSAKVIEQAEIMRSQITHHLDRARVAARSNAIGEVTDVGSVLRALKRTLDRIYEERGLTLELDAAPGLKFQGERQDFEEMVGNLLDNACKWARSNVRASVDGSAGQFTVTVDDDGPGLTKEELARGVKRGQRLDETKPGSGLGLSIVADLAHLYKGRFALEPSPQGGLRARLELPAA
jgi:signal transduction histidine kinase